MISLFVALVMALTMGHVTPLDGVGGGTPGTHAIPIIQPSPLDGVGGGTPGH